jgi:hypothetical protein
VWLAFNAPRFAALVDKALQPVSQFARSYILTHSKPSLTFR